MERIYKTTLGLKDHICVFNLFPQEMKDCNHGDTKSQKTFYKWLFLIQFRNHFKYISNSPCQPPVSHPLSLPQQAPHCVYKQTLINVHST